MRDTVKWVIKNKNADCSEISKKLGINEVIAKIIVNRGFRTYEEAASFLCPNINALPDPFEITDMDKAVSVVKKHIHKRSSIAIYTDYDVDGVMSAAIISKCLSYENSFFYIPDRISEGYGMNISAIERLYKDGVSLIIACDNGITAIDEAKRVYELGMELIIIDHHEPLHDSFGNDILPRAEAIVNPKRSGCSYPFKSMCAAGLCFRFAAAFTGECNDELLVFAAIATVCDIVDLTGDNRIIVKRGLELIKDTGNIGLKLLIEMYELKAITTYHLGFIIGPSINASGRISTANDAVELLLTDNEDRAAQIVTNLYELNKQRKALTEFAVKELTELIGVGDEKVYVLYNTHIHESIAGIAAGRIKEKYNHPTIVITKAGECAKGSARSIDGYNIFNALTEVSGLLTKFGGHTGAAGFSMPYENIDALREQLNKGCTLTDFAPKLYIDARLHISDITFELAEEIASLEPYGKGNKEPVFAEKNVKISKIEFLGKDKTVIKLWLSDAPNITAIAFGLYEKFTGLLEEIGYSNSNSAYSYGCFAIDIAFTVTINEYRGVRSIQLVLKDVRKSAA